MSLSFLIQIAEGHSDSLARVLDDYQPNLGSYTTTIGEFTLIEQINQESDWERLQFYLEMQKFSVLLIFEPNRGGRDEIIFPPNDEEADNGVTCFYWFKAQQRELTRKAVEEKRRLELLAQRKSRRQQRKRRAIGHAMHKRKTRAGGT
jgi:hypothetical protein